MSTGYSNVLNVKDSYVSGGVVLNGATGGGILDDAPAISFWMGQASGQILRIPAGTYRVKTGFSFPGNGTTVIGDGHGCTTILVDDSGGNIGNVFTLTSLRGCRLMDLTIDATVPRSAGRAVYIVGGDAAHQLAAFGIADGGHVIDVDMNNQFNGIELTDNGSALGDWGSVIGTGRKMKWLNGGAGGGFGIFFNCLHGASQVVNNLFLYTPQGGSTAGPAIRYKGSADITLKSIQTIGYGQGFICDPTVNPSIAGDALIQMSDCQWDSTSSIGTDNVQFNLGAGVGGAFVQCEMVNNWIAGATRHGLYVTGDAAGKLFINYTSGTIFQNGNGGTGYGIRVDNGSGPGGAGRLIVGTPVRFMNNVSGATLYT